jgi:protein SCO1/2
VLWNAPAFSFVSHTNRRITNRELAGHVWIANFIFTQCTNSCPLITAKMALLQRRLADPALRFVSFSVDPQHDTPEVLAQYASEWRKTEERWLLLSTDSAGLEAVTQGLHVTLEKTVDKKNPIAHTAQFFLIDAKGSVRGYYSSDNDAALTRLVGDATELARKLIPPSATTDVSGERLYAELGCAACHAHPDLAPPLDGLLGRSSLLDDGVRVTVDSAYIREAIAHPQARVVAGYARLMPEYANLLNALEIQQLAAYVESLQPTSAPAGSNNDASPALETDPACKMRVRVVAATPRAKYLGHQYFFCSDACRQRFENAPDVYVTKQPANESPTQVKFYGAP